MLTSFGLVLSLMCSIEKPYYDGENCAVFFIPLLNAFWLIPYCIYHFKNKNWNNMKFSVLLYLIVVFTLISSIIYNKSFNSIRWKNELDHTKIYDKYPAHKNGDMVPDIIESKILIGLSTENIEKVLGNNFYFTIEDNDTIFWYFYSNKKIFDGCDKLFVKIKKGQCYKAGFGGCD